MLWSQNVHLIRFQCFRLSVDTLLEMEKMKYDVKILGKSWKGKKGSGKEGKFALRKYLGKSWSENIESNSNINRLQFDGTIHCQWVPWSHSIYKYATENCVWTFENSLFLFPVSITQTQFLGFEWWKHHPKNKPKILFSMGPTSFGLWAMETEWYLSLSFVPFQIAS